MDDQTLPDGQRAPTDGSGRPAVSRRRLLATGATGAVAATVAATVGPAAAAADTGDPLLLGMANFGLNSGTEIRSASASAATLSVSNPAGAALRLTPSIWTTDAGHVGSLLATDDGLYGTSPRPGGSGANDSMQFFGSHNATMLAPIEPTRVLDTRSAEGRSRIVDGLDDIDGNGRVRGGGFLVVRLDHLASYAEGLYGNATVTDTVSGGFITVWGTGEVPETSTVNWWDRGQTIANAVLTETGWYTVAGTPVDPVVAFYVNAPTAVIFDVTAFLVPDPWVLAGVPAVAAAGADGRRRSGPDRHAVTGLDIRRARAERRIQLDDTPR